MITRYQQRAEQMVTGFQSPADDYLEGRLNIVDKLVVDETNTFFVAMDSEDMNSYGIRKNDIVVLDKSIKGTSGSIVLAFHSGTFYLRELLSEGGIPVLRSDSHVMKPEVVGDLVIWGVATCMCRNLLPQTLRKGKYKVICSL